MSTEAQGPDDKALDQEIELYGPDDGGWYTTRVMDWIGLCEDVRDPDVRGYLILRSLVIEKFKNPVRKLTMRTLCRLIPGQKKGEPSSHSRVRVMLKSLGAVGLVVDPDTGQPIKTSSRASSLDKPLRLRINDMPKPGYKGWRNTEAKLAALTGQAPVAHPEDTAPGAGSKSNPPPSEDPEGREEAGSKSNPEGPAGSKSDPLGSKSNPRGSKSNPETGSDQGERELPLVLSIGSSLSGTAGEQQEQESQASVADERETATPEEHPDAHQVLAAYEQALGGPALNGTRAQLLKDASELLAVRPLSWVIDRARELPRFGKSLARHAEMSRVPFARSSQDGDGRERCPDHPDRYRNACVICAMAVPAS